MIDSAGLLTVAAELLPHTQCHCFKNSGGFVRIAEF
jgi:hypothetical protein